MIKEEDQLTVAVEGRLDTLTSPELEEKIKPELDSLKKLIFDFAGLEYISSAGLRVLLMAAQAMERAIVRAVKTARSAYGLRGYKDLS